MRTSPTIPALAAAALAAATLVLVTPAPAGAATVTVSGTEITITSSTDETINVRCTSGTVRVNGAATSPTVACSALSKVTVTSSNATDQTVDGRDLNVAAFTAGPGLVATLGGGDDTVTESDRADTISLGAGADQLTLRLPTVANASLDLGADQDLLSVSGTAADDTVSATSTSASAQIAITAPGGATAYTVGNADELRLDGLDGEDTVSATGISAASSIDEVVLIGSDDDDTLRSGVVTAQLQGGAGTNEFDGGAADDTAITASETDVIDLGGGANEVLDTSSLRSGGRTIAAGSGTDTWYLGHYPGDSVARIRGNGSGGSARITAALTRPGQQQLSSFDALKIALNRSGEPRSASIVDLLTLDGTDVTVQADPSGAPRELVDVTVIGGSWSVDGLPGAVTIDPTLAGYGKVSIIGNPVTSVHAPWANAAQGYAHRVVRDLQFRFAPDAERDALRDRLASGTSRATVVGELMDTDEYRGLDVDRVFVKYLRRTADAGGRAYWINSLGDGKALWRFRAQLFGSNEYFTKAGGTNAAYVARAYNDVLGRNPDPSGQTYWTNKLNDGADRGSVALQFMNSPEARRRLVDDQYLRFLERKPTTDEQTFWVARIPTDTGELDLIAALAASTEYYQFD